MGAKSDLYEDEGSFGGVEVHMTARRSVNQKHLYTDAHTRFDVDISTEKKSRTFEYQCNLAYYGPKLWDVLESLLCDYTAYLDAKDFQDFKETFGYEDEVEATKIYEMCKTNARKLDELFGAEGMDEISNYFAERDLEEI